jgi:hypothetical protein
MGLDTKTYWLTDSQSQCDFEFDFDFDFDLTERVTELVQEQLQVSRNLEYWVQNNC